MQLEHLLRELVEAIGEEDQERFSDALAFALSQGEDPVRLNNDLARRLPQLLDSEGVATFMLWRLGGVAAYKTWLRGVLLEVAVLAIKNGLQIGVDFSSASSACTGDPQLLFTSEAMEQLEAKLPEGSLLLARAGLRVLGSVAEPGSPF